MPANQQTGVRNWTFGFRPLAVVFYRLQPVGANTSGAETLPVRGENIDLVSEPGKTPLRLSEAVASRRFVGVHFACCDIYSRVYVNRDETAYAGNCPRCAKQILLKIGPGGTDSRFFTAY